MTKHEITEAYCKLSSRVMDEVFHYNHFADCFCGKVDLTDSSYQFSEEIYKFIEDAVNEKIASMSVVI